jgi:hypothetical protein
MANRTPMPAIVTRNPAMMRVRCARRLARRSARGGVEQYREGRQDPLIHLVTTVDVVEGLGLPLVFSDGNCAKSITEVFDDLSHLDRIDWPLMKERYWNDTASDGDRMRRRMAEFLVYDRVPWSAFLGVGTMTEEVADRVRNILAGFDLPGDVIVKRDWYY